MDMPGLLIALADAAGPDAVSTRRPDCVAYASDMWPRSQIWKLADEPARFPPDAIVHVSDRATLARVLRVCNDFGAPVIPYGGGSGVCGGTLPVYGGVVVDTKRMNRVVSIDRESRLATVEAGCLGQHLEESLREHGFTLGHFPSSVLCSTVGGYVAARSAGQYSSRYGVFADLVRRLTVALPDGRLVETGPGAGALDWSPLVAGSEGTLGVVVDATVRMRPAPEHMRFRGFRLRSVEHGLDAMRRVMQAGLRPCVLRLYDPFDTLIAASEPEAESTDAPPTRIERLVAERLAPLKDDLKRSAVPVLLARPGVLNRLADKLPLGCLLVVGFEGAHDAVERDMGRASRLLVDAGAQDRGPGPGDAWYQNRYAVSFKQSKVFLAGAFVDTMEVSTTWDRVPALYRRVRAAVGSIAFIMAHFSHAYREGCSIYFTFAARVKTPADAERQHERLWETGLTAVARAGGSISHHHGVGIAKREFLPDEYGADGAALFDALKQAFDPKGVMNPGKLWRVPGRAGEDLRQPGDPDAIGPVDRVSGVVRVAAAAPLGELARRLAAEGFALPWWVVGALPIESLSAGTLGELSLGTVLGAPHTLDWGPRYGGLAPNLLAVDAITRGGHRIRQTPTPRRAAGPELTALFVEADRRFGSIEAAVLRVVPVLPRPVRFRWQAAAPAPLLAALRALEDADEPPLRATLSWTPRTGFAADVLVDGECVGLPRLPRDVAATRPDDDDPWVDLPDTGFRGGWPVDRVAIGAALSAAAGAGIPLAASRLDDHGGWLVPLADAPPDAHERLAAAGVTAPTAPDADDPFAARVAAALVQRMA